MINSVTISKGLRALILVDDELVSIVWQMLRQIHEECKGQCVDTRYGTIQGLYSQEKQHCHLALLEKACQN